MGAGRVSSYGERGRKEPSISELSSKRVWPVWAAWFLSAFVLYAATASRGAQWQDSGYFILRILRGELANPLGLALLHPLHYWLGRLAIRLPGLEPAYAITLVSSLAGAVAIANLYACAKALTGRWKAAALAAGSLLVANTFWQLATLVETYTLAAAFLTTECWCVIRLVQIASGAPPKDSSASFRPKFGRQQRLILLLWLVQGLGFANHNLSLLTMPMAGAVTVWAWQKGRHSYWLIPGAAVFWLIGASPQLVFIAREAMASGDVSATIQSALFGTVFEDRVLNASLSSQLLLISAGFVLLNFPNLLLPAAVSGIAGSLGRSAISPLPQFLLIGLAVHLIFAFRYPVPDQHYFFLSTYVFLCLFGSMGFASWMYRPAGRTTKRIVTAALFLLLLTPVVYAFVPSIGRRINALGYVERDKPYRDDFVYIFIPWTFAERSAETMSRQAVDMAGEDGAIVVEDGMAEFAVRYELHRRERRGVEVFSPEMPPREMEAAIEARRRIVLVPRRTDQPTTLPLRGRWNRQGDLYELIPD
jgi:hypothetical protein